MTTMVAEPMAADTMRRLEELVHELGEYDPTEAASTFQESWFLFCVADSRRLVSVNERWTDLLGWSLDELMGRPWLEFIHPDDRDKTLATKESLGSGLLPGTFRNRLLTKIGSYIPVAWIAARGPDGLAFGIGAPIEGSP